MNPTEHNPWRIARWAAIPAVLAIPLVAMQLTSEVAWTMGDFVVAAALMTTVIGSYELIALTGLGARARAGAAVVLALGLVVVWAELAVGLFP